MEGTEQIQNTPGPVGFPGATSVPSSAPKKNWKWLIILVLFLVVIGGVTFFVFKSSKTAANLEQSPTPGSNSDLTQIATPMPSPTPTPAAVDKAQIKIQVLNGTGVAGDASYLSDQLKSLGYTSITTGNASSQSSTDTKVAFSSTLSSDVVTEITTKLQSLYTSVTTDNSSLPTGTDIQVTTGTRKGQANQTPSVSPSPTPAQ